MKGNEKLNTLIDVFGKLEESRKDHIRELCRKLADIHYPKTSCGVGNRGFPYHSTKVKQGKLPGCNDSKAIT